MTYNRSVYVNRLRFSEWTELHKNVGFEIIDVHKKESKRIRKLFDEGKLNYLSKYDSDERYVTSVDLCVKKTKA